MVTPTLHLRSSPSLSPTSSSSLSSSSSSHSLHSNNSSSSPRRYTPVLDNHSMLSYVLNKFQIFDFLSLSDRYQLSITCYQFKTVLPPRHAIKRQKMLSSSSLTGTSPQIRAPIAFNGISSALSSIQGYVIQRLIEEFNQRYINKLSAEETFDSIFIKTTKNLKELSDLCHSKYMLTYTFTPDPSPFPISIKSTRLLPLFLNPLILIDIHNQFFKLKNERLLDEDFDLRNFQNAFAKLQCHVNHPIDYLMILLSIKVPCNQYLMDFFRVQFPHIQAMLNERDLSEQCSFSQLIFLLSIFQTQHASTHTRELFKKEEHLKNIEHCIEFLSPIINPQVFNTILISFLNKITTSIRSSVEIESEEFYDILFTICQLLQNTSNTDEHLRSQIQDAFLKFVLYASQSERNWKLLRDFYVKRDFPLLGQLDRHINERLINQGLQQFHLFQPINIFYFFQLLLTDKNPETTLRRGDVFNQLIMSSISYLRVTPLDETSEKLIDYLLRLFNQLISVNKVQIKLIESLDKAQIEQVKILIEIIDFRWSLNAKELSLTNLFAYLDEVFHPRYDQFIKLQYSFPQYLNTMIDAYFKQRTTSIDWLIRFLIMTDVMRIPCHPQLKAYAKNLDLNELGKLPRDQVPLEDRIHSLIDIFDSLGISHPALKVK